MKSLANLFERVFDIRSGEWQRLSLLYMFAFMLNVAVVWGKASSEALFLSVIGIDFLPLMFVADAILSIITLIIYTAFADRISNLRMMMFIPILGASLLVGSRAAIAFEFGGDYVYYFLFLISRVLQVVISIHAWTYIADFYDTRTAKRHYPLIASGSRTSGILAGLLIVPIVTLFTAPNLIIAWAIALLGSAYISWYAPRREPILTEEVHESSEDKQSFVDNMTEGFKYVRGSNFLRLMAAGAFLSTLLIYLLDFQSQQFFVKEFDGDADRLAAFYGTLGAIANAIALPIQMFILSRIVTKLGVGNGNLIFPSIAGLSFGLLQIPSIFTASLARVNQSALRSAFRTPIDSLLYNAVPVNIKGRARAFNGLLVPAGTLIAGLLLLVDLGEALVLIGIVVSVLYIGVSYAIRGEYSRSLTSLLAQDELNLFRMGDMMQDQPPDVTIRLLKQRIENTDDDALIVFLGEMLYDLQGRQAIPYLLTLADNRDEGVKSGIIDLIGGYWETNQDVRQLCIVGLSHRNVQIRLAALRALVGDGDLEHDEALLDLFLYLVEDDDEEVQAMVIPPLIASGDFYYLAPGVEKLSRWISEDATPTVRTKGLSVLAKTGSERMVRTLVRYVEDEEPMVRRQAASLIDNLTANSTDHSIRYLGLQTLSGLLQDPDDTVRLAAVDGLGNYNTTQASKLLLDAMGDNSFTVRRRASDILSKQVNEDIEASLELENQYRAESAAFILSSSNHTRAKRRAIELMDKLVTDTYSLIAQRVPLRTLDTPGINLLRTTLEEQENELMDRFFWLLGSLSSESESESIRKALQDDNKLQVSNAIEALESLSNATIARRVAPLYTGSDLTQQVDDWRKDFNLPVLSRPQAFFRFWPRLRTAANATIPENMLFLADDDGWLKASAIYAIVELEETHLKDADHTISKETIQLALEATINDQKPLVAETARVALQRLLKSNAFSEGDMLSTIEKVIFLKEVPFFQEMTISQLRVLANISEEMRYTEAQTIFEEGDFGDALYVVINGEVALQRRQQKSELNTSVRRLNTVGEREYFAEMNIFDDKPHQFDAIAIKPTELLIIRRQTLTALINHQPDLSLTLLRALSERLREFTDTIAEKSEAKPQQLVNLFDRLS